MNTKRFAFAVLFLSPLSASIFADIVPYYTTSLSDVTWEETGQNTGIYSVASSAENYQDEVWERSIEDGKLTGVGGPTWTTTGKYYGYGDLESAMVGIGTSMGDDYLFVKWSVVGGFVADSSGKDFGVGHKGHYYFYFQPEGMKGFAVEVTDAVALDEDFDDSNNQGKVNRLIDHNTDAFGTGISVTLDDDGNEMNFDSYEDSQTAGYVRRRGNMVEAAIKLSDFGLTLADLENAKMVYSYAGVAVSNPSSPNSDLFANDHYSESFGSGNEYDTLKFGDGKIFQSIPEPGCALLIFSGLAAISIRRKR